MGNEWTRLTPENAGRGGTEARYRPLEDDSLYSHHLVAGCQELMLTNPEALAFARELSEVEAVEKVLSEVWERRATVDDLGCGYGVRLDAALCDQVRAALANLKGAGDG